MRLSFYAKLETINKKTCWLVIAFMLLFTWNCFFAKSIQIDSGLGWDGAEYANLVNIFPHFSHYLSDYRLQRIFPSILVALGLKLFRLPASNVMNIITGFRVLNFLSVVTAVYFWWRFACQWKLNFTWRLISFSALFLNYALLKMTGYYPVLTDTLAFSLGVALFYFYFKRAPISVFIVGVLGSFTFPSFWLVGVICLYFPFKQSSEVGKKTDVREKDRFNMLASASAAAISLFAFILFVASHSGFSFLTNLIYTHQMQMPSLMNLLNGFEAHMGDFHPGRILNFSAYSSGPLLLICLSLMYFYLYYALKPILKLREISAKLLSDTSLISIFLAVVFLLTINTLKVHLSSGSAGQLTMKSYFLILLTEFSSLPLINIENAVIYFGPIILLIMFFWQEVFSTVSDFSVGLTLLCILMVFLCLASEARQYINLISLPVFLLSICVKKQRASYLSERFGWFFLLSSVFCSKFWLVINIPPVTSNTVNYLANKWQSYFMSQGPWISLESYLIQGGVVMVVAIIMWRYWIHFSKKYNYRLNQ